MQLRGEWFQCTDGAIRPVLRGEVLGPGELWVPEQFLVDTGADVTLLGSEVTSALHLGSNGASQQLGGIDGNVNATIISTQLQFQGVDGVSATFRGNFHAVLDAHNMEMSILGRDIIEMFALIIDRPGDTVCMLREKHHYEIREAT